MEKDNNKPILGVIGNGIVGGAIARGFSDHKIYFYDKYKESDTLETVSKKADIIFISLPTPYKGTKIDLSIIENAVAQIVEYTNNTNKVVVIKSTVIPGTTRRLSKEYPNTKFVFNPEFLTEKNFLQDFMNADRHVIGYDDNEAGTKVVSLYTAKWKHTPVIQTDPTTAEMSKYAANCFLATKVMFANEMYDLCEKLGIQWAGAKEIVVADSRIGVTHLDVSSVRGYGGKCFPKDIVAILGVFEELGVDSSLLSTVWEKNLKIRKDYDWEKIPFAKTQIDKKID